MGDAKIAYFAVGARFVAEFGLVLIFCHMRVALELRVVSLKFFACAFVCGACADCIANPDPENQSRADAPKSVAPDSTEYWVEFGRAMAELGRRATDLARTPRT